MLQAPDLLIEWHLGQGYSYLFRPSTGVVMERSVNVGEIPKRHQDLFVIGRIDTVFVETAIAEARAAAKSPPRPHLDSTL